MAERYLAVGLGWADSGIGDRRDVADRAARASLLDEGLDVIEALWRGELRHHGPRYEVDIASDVLDLVPVQSRVFLSGSSVPGPDRSR